MSILHKWYLTKGEYDVIYFRIVIIIILYDAADCLYRLDVTTTHLKTYQQTRYIQQCGLLHTELYYLQVLHNW